MKLAAVLAFATTLGLGSAVRAEPGLAPPGMSPPVGAAPAPMPGPMPASRPGRARGEIRRVLLETFDANRNGRLDPDERRRAMRTLRRIERRLASGAGNEARRDRAEQRRERRERREQRMERRRERLEQRTYAPAPAEAPASEY